MPSFVLDVKGEIAPMESAELRKDYKIGELADMFGVTCRTIRYYEELGLLESAEREDGGHRRYSERNVVRLKRVQQLKDYGLGLADIQELFELARLDRSGEAVRNRLRDKYREKIEDAQRRKRALEDYIDDLSWHVEQLERVKDFFQCPGASCEACPYAVKCDVRLLLSRN